MYFAGKSKLSGSLTYCQFRTRECDIEKTVLFVAVASGSAASCNTFRLSSFATIES